MITLLLYSLRTRQGFKGRERPSARLIKKASTTFWAFTRSFVAGFAGSVLDRALPAGASVRRGPSRAATAFQQPPGARRLASGAPAHLASAVSHLGGQEWGFTSTSARALCD